MIKADNVTVLFRNGFLKKAFKALDGFSVAVEEGDVFALLGPNGAGKSTAMYCFLGLIGPDSGRISVAGRPPFPGSGMFSEVAYLPEEPHYHLYLTVEEAVKYYADLFGKGIGRQKVVDAIDRVGLTEFRDLRLSKCSKGMKQKVGIAQCLVTDPKLIFLDEPTRGLDPITVKEFRDILIEMNKKGATIVLNSHVLSEIEMICNRVAIMNRGRVIAQDELNRLRGLNREVYQVELDRSDALPAFIEVIMKTQSTVKGEIPCDLLKDFIQFADVAGLKVYECSLKKVSLEDAFFSILKDGE
ncbi:MAG: ABC transporter ATP-binding protein [Nitrospirae bacterium]|nr:ABC transporter ATP-binding protein [Nitrospirota bacterium]